MCSVCVCGVWCCLVFPTHQQDGMNGEMPCECNHNKSDWCVRHTFKYIFVYIWNVRWVRSRKEKWKRSPMEFFMPFLSKWQQQQQMAQINITCVPHSVTCLPCITLISFVNYASWFGIWASWCFYVFSSHHVIIKNGMKIVQVGCDCMQYEKCVHVKVRRRVTSYKTIYIWKNTGTNRFFFFILNVRLLQVVCCRTRKSMESVYSSMSFLLPNFHSGYIALDKSF